MLAMVTALILYDRLTPWRRSSSGDCDIVLVDTQQLLIVRSDNAQAYNVFVFGKVLVAWVDRWATFHKVLMW